MTAVLRTSDVQSNDVLDADRDLAFDDEEQVSRIVPVERVPVTEHDHQGQYRRLHQLLARRRFEDALDLLCSIRDEFPRDEALGRSIRLLRDHLSAKYAERLQDLDVVPRVVDRGVPLAEYERRVLALVDGVSSFGELLLTSPLGQFDTLRALFNLARLGVIADDVVVSASRRPPPPESAAAPPEYGRLLQPLEALDGFWGSALVDSVSGAVLGSCGEDPGALARLGALYAEVLQLQRRATQELGLGEPDDLIITRPDEYHLVRPLGDRPDVFICLITDRGASNLALSRLALTKLEPGVAEALAGASSSFRS
ncbi:MAG: roadblock/LC7 domain-containing protein [Polyangiaceae bacterium]